MRQICFFEKMLIFRHTFTCDILFSTLRTDNMHLDKHKVSRRYNSFRRIYSNIQSFVHHVPIQNSNAFHTFQIQMLFLGVSLTCNLAIESEIDERVNHLRYFKRARVKLVDRFLIKSHCRY